MAGTLVVSGVVGRPGREDVGEPAVVERSGRTVTAQQKPVALGQLDGEQVGIDLVDAVERLQDQVAVGMGPSVHFRDPALVDQALDERVVAGELADLVATEQVRATVTDVSHRQT